MDFGGTLTGAGLGALAGLGLGGPHHQAGDPAVGGLVGAGLGFVADVATRVTTEIIVIDFQITERLSEEEDITGQKIEKSQVVTDSKVLGGMGTTPDFPTHKIKKAWLHF
jgi:hypothetical protein